MKKGIQTPSAHETTAFYDDLMEGNEKRGILGKDKRFNNDLILKKRSTQNYFVDVLKPYLKKTDRVLDFGCGPGAFLAAIAPFCGEILGVDISKNFASTCGQTILDLKLLNAQALHIEPDALPFPDASFDAVVMVDVIHHLENISKSLKEVFRVLKKGGKILIFEPNKLNPVLTWVHLRDRNEWGLLRLGTPQKYRKILRPFMQIEVIDFNGLVIGPQSSLFDKITAILNSISLRPFIGWLNPKIFIHGRKR